jgi:uncharacterized membrane protein HdeD (DUF308 family)
MEFRVLLGSITLFLAGFMLLLLAAGKVDATQVVGIVLLVDGAIFAIHGLMLNADASSKRLPMVWGSVLALAGITVLAYPAVGSSLVIYVVGVAMVLIGLFVLYGEAYGGKS